MSRLLPLLLVPLLALAGCGGSEDADARDGTLAEKVVREVREEMATENLSVGGGNKDLPRAEITPEGVLLVDGRAVPMDEAQKALAIEYRRNMAAVAEAGASIGMEAAGLAKDSVVAAIEGVFSGESQETLEAQVEAQVKQKAEGIEAAARSLCGHLPALLASERALADAVPEFAPYAEMDESDVDDCHVNVN